MAITDDINRMEYELRTWDGEIARLQADANALGEQAKRKVIDECNKNITELKKQRDAAYARLESLRRVRV